MLSEKTVATSKSGAASRITVFPRNARSFVRGVASSGIEERIKFRARYGGPGNLHLTGNHARTADRIARIVNIAYSQSCPRSDWRIIGAFIVVVIIAVCRSRSPVNLG